MSEYLPPQNAGEVMSRYQSGERYCGHSELDEVTCDFRGADLRGAIFQDAALEGTDFAGVILKGAEFEGAGIYGVSMKAGDLPDW